VTIEIFGLLDTDGCNNVGVYILCGKKSEIGQIARPLQEYYEANRRRRTVHTLATRFAEASQMQTPLIRIEKPEGMLLMNVLSELSENKSAGHVYRKLYDRFAESLCVF